MEKITFSVLGNEIVFDEKTIMFNTIRNKYLKLSRKARKKVEVYYDDTIKTLSDYRRHCKRGVGDIFNEYLKIGVIELISYGIYDIDEVVLREESEKDFGSAYKKAVDDVIHQIELIEASERASDAERKEMIAEAGSTMQTVGYLCSGNLITDIGSMVVGELGNAAVNATLAGGTALVTGGIRAVERRFAEKEKQDIFERKSTKQGVLTAIENDVYMLHKTVARLINERIEPVFYYASEEALKNVEPINRNILGGNFNYLESIPDLEKKQIKKILEINPYETRVYCYIMKNNGGLSEELRVLLDFLGIDMQAMADTYLRSVYDMFRYGTYEEMLKFEETIRAEMIPFGVTECNYLFDVLNLKQQMFDIRRTFNGYLYETIEEKDKAEEQFTAFLADGLDDMDIDQLIDKYFETLQPEYTEKNREDLQKIVIEYVAKYMEMFQCTQDIMPYIEQVEVVRQNHGLEKLSLLDALNKKYKQLARKEQISVSTAAAKETLMATATAAKEKVARLGNAKNMFAGTAEKLKSSVDGYVGKSNKEPDSPGTKTCPQCGADVKDTSKFCGKCGYHF